MVTDYSGSAVLKSYTLVSNEEKSYILGFPYMLNSNNKRKDDAYTDFSKTVIKRIKKTALNRGAVDIVIEQAANAAVESNSWNFKSSKIQDGFFFPKLSSSNPGNLDRAKQFLKSN